MTRVALAVLGGLLLVAAPAHAKPGDLDRTFAGNGRVAFNPYGHGGSVRSLTLLEGRRPLLSVDAQRRDTYGPTLLRLTAGGALAQQTQFPPEVWDPPEFASGYALQRGASPVLRLSRIGSTRSVTLPLDADRDRYGESLRFGVDRAGRVIVVGYREARRFLPSGKPDASYGTDGVAKLTGIRGARAVLVRRDGRVYASGGRRLIALDTRGRRDRRVSSHLFAVPGIKFPEVTALAEGPGKTLIVAGARFRDEGFVGRLRADGRPDRRFGRRGFASGFEALERLSTAAIARDRRGRLVLAGMRIEGEDAGDASVVRFSARGRIDRTFATHGRKRFLLGRLRGVKLESSDISELAIDDRGRIVVAGRAYDTEFELREDIGNPYPAIARLKG